MILGRLVAVPARSLVTAAVPRPLSIVRAWSYAAAAGAGVASYVGYRLNEFADQHTPAWLKRALERAKEVDWQSMGAEFSLPDLSGGVTALEVVAEDIHGSWAQMRQRWQSAVQSGGFAGGGREGAPPPGPPGPGPGGPGGLSAAAVTLGAVASAPEDDERGAATPADDETVLLELSRELIEIRNLLRSAAPLPYFYSTSPDALGAGARDPATAVHSTLGLPTIVVVGSQSSGKSSVLEAIVGREFLPKGSNMVTRRPIELTLRQTAPGTRTVATLPALQMETEDFGIVQRALTDLNLAVPASECVSREPIELEIRSPDVPDLCLTDLPGYIAVTAHDQPAELREKISALCQTYLQEPNVILAVCAADVDLANAEALRAARAADPRGQRTLGVLTKMDLVSPEAGAALATNNKYPLTLGYVCVVVGGGPAGASAARREQREAAYFGKHDAFRALAAPGGVLVGVPALRRALSVTLARSMADRVAELRRTVQHSLAETSYFLKVHYNDAEATPEAYVAELVDQVKTRCRSLSREWGKRKIRDELQAAMDAQAVQVLRSLYWASPEMGLSFSRECAQPGGRWSALLNAAASSLTKAGVGRLSTTLIRQRLGDELDALLESEPLQFHASALAACRDNARELLDAREAGTVDQVENGIKPLKYHVDLSDAEWREGQRRAEKLVAGELEQCHAELNAVKTLLGRRTLRAALLFLEQVEPADGPAPVAPELLERARAVAPLLERSNMLKTRLAALQSRQCGQCPDMEQHLSLMAAAAAASSDAGRGPAADGWSDLFGRILGRPPLSPAVADEPYPAVCRCCPEVFLEALAAKLSSSAALLIYHELLADFFTLLPRRVEQQLYKQPDRAALQAFARENPLVRTHIDVIERRAILQRVVGMLDTLSVRVARPGVFSTGR